MSQHAESRWRGRKDARHIHIDVRRMLSIFIVLSGILAAWGIGWRGARSQSAAASAGVGGSARSAGVLRMDSLLRVREWTLRRIAESSTYLPAMLTQSDSVLKRWSDRTSTPLLVYLPQGGAPDYRPELGEVVRSAFDRWERVAGIPVLFVFTRDSSRADVVVRWIGEFPIERTGQADVRWNGAGWLISGTLTLATHNPGGIVLP